MSGNHGTTGHLLTNSHREALEHAASNQAAEEERAKRQSQTKQAQPEQGQAGQERRGPQVGEEKSPARPAMLR